jgi:hypothetical protein
VPFEIQDVRPDPALDVVADDAAGGGRVRLTTLSGALVAAPPPPSGIEIRVRGRQEPGESVGLYVPGLAEPLPAGEDVTLVAEAALTQLVVVGMQSHEAAYGIAQVEAQLVPDDRHGGARWVWLGFLCFGYRALGVRYRVTLKRPA